MKENLGMIRYMYSKKEQRQPKGKKNNEIIGKFKRKVHLFIRITDNRKKLIKALEKF